MTDQFTKSALLLQGGMVGGVLTTVGQEQVYVLGRRLAARYHDNLKLIGKHFDEKEVQLVQSDIFLNFYVFTAVELCLGQIYR